MDEDRLAKAMREASEKGSSAANIKKEQLQAAKDKLTAIAAECQDALIEAIGSSSVFGTRRTETPVVREEDEIGGSVLVSDVKVIGTGSDFVLTLGGPVTLVSFGPTVPTSVSGDITYKLQRLSNRTEYESAIPGAWQLGGKFILNKEAFLMQLESAIKRLF